LNSLLDLLLEALRSRGGRNAEQSRQSRSQFQRPFVR
jgi:hypothetical protein